MRGADDRTTRKAQGEHHHVDQSGAGACMNFCRIPMAQALGMITMAMSASELVIVASARYMGLRSKWGADHQCTTSKSSVFIRSIICRIYAE